MKIVVKRITLSNECKKIVPQEGLKVRAFQITNLGTAAMYADFETITSADKGVIIPAGMSRIVLMSIQPDAFASDAIYVKGSGLVEVQAVDF